MKNQNILSQLGWYRLLFYLTVETKGEKPGLESLLHHTTKSANQEHHGVEVSAPSL